MAANRFARLLGLLSGSPVIVASVISTTGTSSVVELPSGDQLTVRGTGTVGGNVFVRGGTIEGPAPNLPEVHIDV